jgi:mannan polymerase II complex MNN10 subunit
LALNTGGGVLGWKSSEQWAVERTSVKNKQDYVRRHGYALAIRDMPMQRRYAHEWRESWEKVDIIREVMQAYPKAEWFWWLDVSTYIMEPHISLESHLFDKLEEQVYRNLSNSFNPLDIPDDLPFVDNKHDINLIIPQDCGGFNLGSFFIKRSDWTTRLLDIWWDPVHYEQKHMQWEHKEQDALEALYRNHAWIRSGTAFVGNRKINAFPPGACADVSHDRQFFYGDRDFCVNLAGCQFGRNCYDEVRKTLLLMSLTYRSIITRP